MAAAVVLDPESPIAGIADSKKLSAARRAELALRIQCYALGWAVASASVAEIDQLNILHASLLAMRRAVAALTCRFAGVRIDGNRAPDLAGVFSGPVETLVKGDALCPAIGAASILAKVARDEHMAGLHEKFPGYGFERHKGYPTAEHREALFRLGPLDEHRRSFRPVQEACAHWEQHIEAVS
jgi:ribonuclease HII